MNKALTAIGAIALVAAGGYGLYRLGLSEGAERAASASFATGTSAAADATSRGGAQAPALTAGAIDPATGKRILYWHDPMAPNQKFDRPGKSPFMDMDLVPVYADEGSGGSGDNGVTIDSRLQQNLGIRTAEAVEGALVQSLEAVGTIAWNERDVAVVQARANGYVERLYVRAPLDAVRKGQPLAELYVPDWVAAQEDYLAVRRMQLDARLVDGARQRMRLAGMSDEQIAGVEASGRVQPRLVVTAPIGGVVAELAAREGMTVTSGAALFRINGLSTVWVNAEVPETAAALVRPGAMVEATTPALEHRTFKGKVGALLPEVNPTTRTIKARVELANSGGQLLPGMFVRISLSPPSGRSAVLVPSEAVMRTGRRNLVMEALADGRFAPVEVEVGAESGGRTEIRKGLAAGKKVVVSGQFLIDSEASLRGFEARLADVKGKAGTATNSTPPKATGQVHAGTGKVEAIDDHEVTVAHGEIPSLKWPAMTMAFHLAAGRPRDVERGSAVQFEFRETANGEYEIVTMRPMQPASNPSGATSARSGASSAAPAHGAHK
jgi:Cu(I)/Ag(I) efflux system membrane fusion protein